MLVESLPVLAPSGLREHSRDLPTSLSHRLGDGKRGIILHCMNDPQPEGHMASYIGRRKFLATLLGGAVAWPRGLLAEATSKRAMIAWLWAASQSGADEYVRAGKLLPPFLKGMQEFGYTEGRDFEMVYRFAAGDYDRMPRLAAELAALNPNVFIAPATAQAVVVKKVVATTIPIVVPVLADPVGLGLVASEARPGGNLTGISPYVKGLPAKQLELAREIVPGATRIGLLDDPTDPKAFQQRREIEAKGQELKARIVVAEARKAGDVGPAYEVFAAERVEVVVVEQSNMLINARKQIAEAAAAKKLPSVYGYREHVEAGGLISYGVDLNWCFHRAAYYVDRILKGTKPADLPVEFPTEIELVINLKTATVLGLEVPPTLLVRADAVIE
jgi:putative tryptophan/tyrosine transport system substrate-binding protein